MEPGRIGKTETPAMVASGAKTILSLKNFQNFGMGFALLFCLPHFSQ